MASSTRRLEVMIVGDASGLKKALGSAGKDANTFGKGFGKSLGGLKSHIAGVAAGLTGAFASIEGAKKAVDTTEELAHVTLSLHKNLGLTVEQASRWGAVAQARGIDSKQLAQAFGTLSKGAVGVGTASAKQQKALAALGTSQADVKAKAALLSKGLGPQAEAFRKLGLSTKDVQGANRNFEGFLGKVADGFGRMHGGSDKAALGMKLFGRGWQSVLPVLRSGSKGMDDQLKLADKYGVTFKGKTVKSLEGLIKAQRESKFATMGLQVAFGTMLAPALTKAMQGVNHFIVNMRAGKGTAGEFGRAIASAASAVQGVVHWLGQHKNIAIALAGAVASLVAITKVHAAVTRVSTALTETWTAVTKVASVATKAWAVAQAALNLVMDANPVVLVGAAIIALGAALVLAYTKVKVFRTVVKAAWSAIKTATVAAFNGVKAAVSAAIHFVTGLFPKVATAAKFGFLGPIPLIISRFGQIKGAISSIVSAVVSTIKSIPGKVAGVGQAIVQAILSGLGNIGSAIAGKITGALKGLKGLAHKALKAITGAATFPGLPSLSAIEGTANQRVSGLLFPATRKGDILESLAGQAVNSRRRELTIAKNAAGDAAKAHPKNKQLAKDYQAATRALRDFNVEAKTYIGIFHKQNVGLQAIQKFKDAITGLRDKMHSLAGDAASAFRATREKQIATGPQAQQLAALQGIDAAQQDAKTTDQLNQDLADAKASGDVKAQKDAQDAIDAYARQKQEQALQDQIDAQNAGLDAEETNYQNSLDSRLSMLTDNLSNGKESYKQYVADVQSILGPLGVAFAGDPSEEQDINPVGAGSAPKGKGKPKHHRRKRAVGGSVVAGMAYDVGELGPEVFTPSSNGTITQASQSSRGAGGGVTIHIAKANIGSRKSAHVMANKLAWRVRFG